MRLPESVHTHGWWFGALGGVVLAVVLGLGTQAYQEQRETRDREALGLAGTGQAPEPVDMVRDLLAEQERAEQQGEQGQVVVHPELADRVEPEHLQRARSLLADAPSKPSRRIAYAPSSSGLETGYTTSGAIDQWMHAIGEEGHYVMLFDDGVVQVEAIGMEDMYISDGAKGQPGPALVRVAEQVADWHDLPESAGQRDSEDWDGPWGGVMAGLMLGTFTVVPFFLILRWVVGRRRPKEF